MHYHAVDQKLNRIISECGQNQADIAIDLVRTGLVSLNMDIDRWRNLEHRSIWAGDTSKKLELLAAVTREIGNDMQDGEVCRQPIHVNRIENPDDRNSSTCIDSSILAKVCILDGWHR